MTYTEEIAGDVFHCNRCNRPAPTYTHTIHLSIEPSKEKDNQRGKS